MKINVLLTAYAVNPFKGSEDGTGWNIIYALSEKQPILAITRRNNQAAIERYCAENNISSLGKNLRFAYYDLPNWLSWWKKGSRGALLYHYLWHLGVIFFILRQGFQFPIAHHLNFHSSWSPSFLWLLGKPVIWGPVGHHPKIPATYLQHYSWKEKAIDQLKWWVKKIAWKFDPFLFLCKHKVKAILAVNSSVATVMGSASHKVTVVPAIATEAAPAIAPLNGPYFNVLSIGRFVSLKGFDMLIEAFSCFYQQLPIDQRSKAQLTIIGKGPDEELLQALAKKRQLPESVIKLVKWVPKNELKDYFLKANVFFFPSHEGAGMVIPEAMSFGLPILTYQNSGPGESIGDIAGICIPYSNYQESIRDFADKIHELYQFPNYQKKLGKQSLKRFKEQYTWSQKAADIQAIYHQIS